MGTSHIRENLDCIINGNGGMGGWTALGFSMGLWRASVKMCYYRFLGIIGHWELELWIKNERTQKKERIHSISCVNIYTFAAIELQARAEEIMSVLFWRVPVL